MNKYSTCLALQSMGGPESKPSWCRKCYQDERAENKKLIQYKDYVESRISENILPKTYEEWNTDVETLAKELEQALKKKDD